MSWFNILFFFFFFFFFLSAVHTLTPSSEIAALQAFKSSIKPTSISPSSCLASWDFTADPCSNPRVTHFTCGLSCANNHVTQITLEQNNYSGMLTPLISKLTQLITLDLSDNNFYGPIPTSLSSLPNLQTLILRANKFSGSIPPSLTSLKSLQSVDLSHNLFSGSLPNSMSSLTNLRRLDLSYNKLTGYIPKLPPNLIELAVKANSLSGSLYKSSFEGCNQLEVVELSENKLTGTLQGWFFLLPSLQQADLANNSFTRLEVLKPAANSESDLVAVILSFNMIEGYIPVNFADYPMLSALYLSYNRLRGPIPWQFGKKDSLKRVYLDGNYLNGSPPAGFFGGGTSVSGSLGDNCLQNCPMSSQLCFKSQKPTSICQQAYGGKPRS